MIVKIKNSRVTKINVCQAADLIANRGEVPTIAKVRAELEGRGSETTIHNYLKEWKKAKLLSKQEPSSTNYNQDLLLVEEKRSLEQALHKQIAKNEQYAQELIDAEKANVVLKEKNYQLEATIRDLNLELTKATAINHTLENLANKIEQQLAVNDNNTINKQNILINELQQELKNLNAKSMAAIQELSSKAHETLMQEKVNVINLQARVDTLHKELAESKKQLELANNRSHAQNQALQRHINWQKQILKKHVPLEELQVLEQSPELLVLEDIYGK